MAAPNSNTPAAKVPVSQQISPDGMVISNPSTPTPAPAPPITPQPNEQPKDNADSNILPSDSGNTDKQDNKAGKPDEAVSTKPADDDTVIDLSDFQAVKDTNVVPEVKKKNEPIDTKPIVKPIPTARDYSDIPDEDKPLFEKMGNEAFAKIKPIYLERKAKDAELATKQTEIDELRKGRIPESYTEHPNAVVLTPEFEQASSAVNYADAISKHWETQFDKVKGGDETYQSIHLNDKGELYLSEPVKVDKTTETQLLKYVTWAQNQLDHKRGDLQTLVQSHRAKSAETINWAKEYEKKAFTIFDKPEGKDLKAIADDTIKTFPKAYHNNPLIGMLTKSIVLNMMFGNQLKAKASAAPAAIVTKSNGNLSAADIAGDSGGTPTLVKVGDSFDDFAKYKEGLPV